MSRSAYFNEELKKRGIKNGICIVGEPTNMKIIDGHKGCYEYTTHFEGLAGHGSAPEKGVNAVEYAASYVNKLLEIREILKKRLQKILFLILLILLFKLEE